MSLAGFSTADAKSARRVRLVVPTSTSRAPDCSITSGTRNPPPISTNSPRETAAPRSVAKAANTNSTADAPLFTTMASSASHSRANNAAAWAWREPRRPDDRSNSRLA